MIWKGSNDNYEDEEEEYRSGPGGGGYFYGQSTIMILTIFSLEDYSP